MRLHLPTSRRACEPVSCALSRTFVVRRGLIDRADAAEMRAWAHDGGFSVDGSVRIEGADRIGLEPLLRYWARPPFALERPRARLAKPAPVGQRNSGAALAYL